MDLVRKSSKLTSFYSQDLISWLSSLLHRDQVWHYNTESKLDTDKIKVHSSSINVGTLQQVEN